MCPSLVYKQALFPRAAGEHQDKKMPRAMNPPMVRGMLSYFYGISPEETRSRYQCQESLGIRFWVT